MLVSDQGIGALVKTAVDTKSLKFSISYVFIYYGIDHMRGKHSHMGIEIVLYTPESTLK